MRSQDAHVVKLTGIGSSKAVTLRDIFYQFARRGAPRSIHVASRDDFQEAIAVEDGVVYRGQTRDYGTLVPSLYRLAPTENISGWKDLAVELYVRAYEADRHLDSLEWDHEVAAEQDARLEAMGPHADDLETKWGVPRFDDDQPLAFLEHGPLVGGPFNSQYQWGWSDLESRFSRGELASGLLQHYGVPTAALDVTFDPEVALWFATNRFVPTGRREGHYVNDRAGGIVYVFSARDVIDLGGERTVPLAGLRGRRQHGGLLVGATDKRSDLSGQVVRKILLPQGGLLRSAPNSLGQTHLFPGPDEDRFFGQLLDPVHEADRRLRPLLNWVVRYVDPPEMATHPDS